MIGEQVRESFCTQATVQSALSFSVKCCRFAQSPLHRHLLQNDITHLRRVEEDEIKMFLCLVFRPEVTLTIADELKRARAIAEIGPNTLFCSHLIASKTSLIKCQ